ncbi:hypothetical protein JOQ06_019712, partial [Pogonophryne albipinna]
MFFIKQQQSASCTQLLITHQTRAIGAAAVMGSGRSCCIEIENECDYTFGNPRTYLYSGVCATPFPPTVAPGASGSAQFKKKPVLARGSIGVVTYDLLNNDTNQTAEEIAVMFHVPFDFNLYHNCYAVGLFDQRT